jgi:GTPase
MGSGVAGRAGFVVLAGRPNVGKSTLLNRLLGEKVAIVSPRPQTTRTRILGVYNGPGLQIAFFDTPGIHAAKGPLNRQMVDVALATLSEVDAAVLVADAERLLRRPGDVATTVDPEDEAIAERLARSGRPAALVFNKVDAVARARLLPLMDAYRALMPWSAIYPLSAKTGEGVEGLPGVLAPMLPDSPPLFPDDVLTDQAERILAAEYVREQVFRNVREEVPYGVAVEVRQFDESERETGPHGLVRIEADVIVERDSHKGIVIGKRGAVLRRIGAAARHDLERLFGTKVWLGLHVRVEKDWTRRPGGLSRFE